MDIGLFARERGFLSRVFTVELAVKWWYLHTVFFLYSVSA
jgi:hypothetical protein